MKIHELAAACHVRRSLPVLAGIAVAMVSGVSFAQRTNLVSGAVAPGIATLDQPTFAVRVSEGGTREFIHSYASNVVEGDDNGVGDIFYRDAGGPWLRAFSGTGGVSPNGESQEDFSISSDGRWLIFVSTATNLVPGDTNGEPDVFLRDMSNGAMRRVNIERFVLFGSFPQFRGPSVTNDGAMVCFVTNKAAITGSTSSGFEVVTHNVQTQANRITPADAPARCTISPNKLGVVFEDNDQIWYHNFMNANPFPLNITPTGPGNGPSTRPLVAGTGFGTFVFTSAASNLVPGDTNGSTDVFALTETGTVTRISVAADGSQLPDHSVGLAISRTADVVVFRTLVRNTMTSLAATPQLFVRDLRATPNTRRVAAPATSGWTPVDDFFRAAAVTTSLATPRVLFISQDMGHATDRTYLIHDAYRAVPGGEAEALVEGAIQTAGGNGDSLLPRLANGQRVAFYSAARNLVAGDFNGRRDVFLHDPSATPPLRLVTRVGTVSATGDSFDIRPPAMTPDGGTIAFRTTAPLVGADVNAVSDIYVWRAATPTQFALASLGTSGAPANGDSFMPSISTDGRYVAFASSATNLVFADTNGYADVFVRDIVSGTTVRASVGPLAQQGLHVSFAPEVSNDGQSVAFCTHATNLAGAAPSADPMVVLKRLGNGSVTRITPPGAKACAFDYAPDQLAIAYGDLGGGWLFPLTTGGTQTQLFMQNSEPRSLSLSTSAGSQRGLVLPPSSYPAIFSAGVASPQAIRTPLSLPQQLERWFFESATTAPTGRAIAFDNMLALVPADANVNVFDVLVQPDPLLLFGDGFE